MELPKIETSLNDPDMYVRVRAVLALRSYEAEVAVPHLLERIRDREFLVRSLTVMALGKFKTSESFAALLEVIKLDRDTNVKAEAANSLSLFGSVAVSHLVLAFYQNENWLVRRSIIAAMAELDCPEELLEICDRGLQDEDFTVREASASALGVLANTNQNATALAKLLEVASNENARMRAKAAYALKAFDDEKAKIALAGLREDSDRQVVAAALEGLL